MNDDNSQPTPTQKWGWGIIGPGHIARKFAADLSHVPNATKCAVFSRTLDAGKAFAAEFGFDHADDDLAHFLARTDLQIVYIATPHIAHAQQAIAAIEAGKHVLIEKPIAMNSDEVRAIKKAASDNGVFAMEALWSRFLPAIQRAKIMVYGGVLGGINRAHLSLYYERDFNPQDRLFNADLGGGVMHDLGVYPISIASFLFGKPALVESAWRAAPNGVNNAANIKLMCGTTPVSVAVGFGPERDNSVDIYGSNGALRIDRHFVRGGSITKWDRPRDALPPETGNFFIKARNKLGLHGGKRERFAFEGHGLHFQASAVQAALGQGLTSHPVMSLNESATVLDIITQILAQPPSN